MTTEIPAGLSDRLQRHNQSHVLRWWNDLSESQRRLLVAQLERIDFETIESLFAATDRSDSVDKHETVERARLAGPPGGLVRQPPSSAKHAAWEEAVRVGNEMLAAGRVGAILVAGGQGSRLGFMHPKGMFPIGPVSRATLFQILAEQLLARSRRAQAAIPYFIMTSDATHAETVAFFRQHDHFGLEPDDVFFFQQGNMPAVDEQGRLLLEDKGRLCQSPDGHGGMLAALQAAGLLEEMRRRGIEHLYYHQVDNPTAIVCDPALLGFHQLRTSEMTTKVVAKRSADEKMGVVVDVGGQTQIIEYSDLPADVAAATDERGKLRLWAGNTAIHVFRRDFLERLVADELALPFHLAHKSVPHLDENGTLVEPRQPNAWKFERFIFDALPHAEHALVVEADRTREFNPVKNATGHDSPATAQAAMSAMFRNWVQSAGGEVADNAIVEISPLFALDADELAGRLKPGTRLEESVYLDGSEEA